MWNFLPQSALSVPLILAVNGACFPKEHNWIVSVMTKPSVPSEMKNKILAI